MQTNHMFQTDLQENVNQPVSHNLQNNNQPNQRIRGDLPQLQKLSLENNQRGSDQFTFNAGNQFGQFKQIQEQPSPTFPDTTAEDCNMDDVDIIEINNFQMTTNRDHMQSVVKLPKNFDNSDDEWSSPRPRMKCKQKEKEASSSDDSASDKDSDGPIQQQKSPITPMQLVQMKTTDSPSWNPSDQQTAEKNTQPETGPTKNSQETEKEENVVDMISFHSRLSKNPFEADVIQKSVKSSKFSTKDKEQISKAIKKVNFFTLKPESILEHCDLDSEGMEESNDYNIDAMNRSIQQQKTGGGLKKNAKSFNFSQKQLNDFINNADVAMDKMNITPLVLKE